MSIAASILEPLRCYIYAANATTDSALLLRFAERRDPEAFRDLVERHGPLVLGMAHRIAGNMHADDIFQATFLKLARKAGNIRRSAALAVWLHRTAYRLALDARRAERRRRSTEIRSPISQERDPLDELSARELLAILDAEIERLPDRDREPLILCCLQGLSLDEAATRLGVSRDAVKGRLERSRVRLGKAFAKRGFLLPAILAPSLLLAPSAVARPLVESTISVGLGTSPVPAAVASLLIPLSRKRLWLALAIGMMGVSFGLETAAKSPAPEPPPVANAPAPQPPAHVDRFGDPLPEGALMRLGTIGFRVPGVEGVGFRPNGDLVALTNYLTLHVWPAEGSSKSSLFSVTRNKRRYGRVALSADAHFAAATIDRQITVWDLSGEQSAEYLSYAVGDVSNLKFSPAGNWLAASDRVNQVVLLCNLKTKTWDQFPIGVHYAESLAFTPDSKSLVVLAHQTATIIDTSSRKVRCEIQCPRTNLRFAALSPDGRTLALQPVQFIHGAVPRTRLLSVPEGKEIEGMTPPTGLDRWVQFSPDGKTLLLGGLQSVRQWDPSTGILVRETVGPGENPIVYSANGHRFATYGRNAVLFADVKTGKAIYPERIDAGHTDSIVGLTLSPDGKFIATNSASDGDVRIWSADSGRMFCAIHSTWGNDRRLAFLPNSQTFIAVARDYVTPVVYDSSTGRELRRFSVSPEMAKAEMTGNLQISGDGKTLTTFSTPIIAGKTLFVVRWDIATGRPISRVERVERDLMARMTGFNFESPDGRWRIEGATAIRDGTGDSILLIPANEAFFFAPPAFSNDSGFVAVTRTPRAGMEFELNRSSVVIFDLVARTKMCDLPIGRPLRMAFSPDARNVAVAGEEEITIWDVVSGKRLKRFRIDERIGWTNAITFTPDGKRLVTGHDDCTALIWDLSPQVIAPLTPTDCTTAWSDLISPDAAKGFAAVCRLTDDPKQSLPFLKERLRPVSPPSADEIKAMLNDLGSSQFAKRDAAEQALRSYDDRIESLLRDALKVNPSAEAKKRIEMILTGFAPSAVPHGELLRGIRAVWVLERIGTPEARRILEELAKGLETARLTREAKAAMGRLSR